MSVDFGIFVVDWKDFAGRIDKGDDPFDVIEGREQEPLSLETLEAQDDFLSCLDRLRDRMAPDDWNAASELFDHLFWSWRGPDKQILECGEPDAGIDVAWSPGTVKRFAETWRRVNLAALRSAFEAAKPPPERFSSAEEFISSARECGECLDRAAREDKGLVVYVFG